MSSFPPWDELFPPVHQPAWTLRFRVLRKHGKPLLLLPPDPAAAAHALQLFPAQTPLARAARALARWMVRGNVGLGAEFVRVPFASGDPLVSLLAEGCAAPGQPPRIAVLAGNAATPGRRFIIVTFGADNRPRQVAKIGVSPAARQLIRAEEHTLKQLSGKHVPGVPVLRSSLHTERLCGFCLDYVGGRNPRGAANLNLLRSWIQPGLIVLGHAPAWHRLAAMAATHTAFPALNERLRSRTVHSVLWHGDFAPWNIKVDPQGEWQVLDWERAECEGIPAWDWFHYVLQREILVHKAEPKAVARVAHELLKNTDFVEYARAAGITGIEHDLLLAYVLYMRYVVCPSEGSSVIDGLLGRLGERRTS